MPREFNGSTDRIDYGSAFTTSGQALSIAMWIRPDSVSIGASGRFMLSSAISGGSNGTFFGQAASLNGALQFGRVRATTNRTCNSAGSLLAGTTWAHVVVTDTGTLSTGQTAFYVNGAAVALGADTAGSGTETTADQGFSIGGRLSDDLRMYDGQLAHVAVYDRVLTADEAYALSKGCPPTLISGCQFYARMNGDDYKNLFDATGTLDGTAATQATNTSTRRAGFARFGLGSAGTPAPTISSTSDTNTLIDESALTINGANLTSATAVTFKQTDRPDFNATAYIATNGASSIVLDPIDIQVMGYAYGAATVEVTTAGGTSAGFAITISPASGTSYVTLAGHTTGTGYATDLASDNGDQLTYPSTVAGSTVSVDADGNISFTPDVPDGTTFTREWFDASSDTWATDTVQIDGGEVAEDGDDDFLFRRHRYLAWQRTGRFNP